MTEYFKNGGMENSSNNNEPNNLINMEALLKDLKHEDARNLRMMKSFKWIFLVMIIIYAGLMVVNPDPELMLHHRITGMCYVIAFALFYLVFRKYNTEFSNIDYSLPSSEMLARAAKRYELKFRRYLNVLPSLLLIDAGLTISEFYRWSNFGPVQRILLIQAFYIPLILISALVGYLIWRGKQRHLRDQSLALLKELQEG
jgi:hypothetical protein